MIWLNYYNYLEVNSNPSDRWKAIIFITVITKAATHTHTISHNSVYFYRFVCSCRVTEYFSAITPTQHDRCLFSAAGLCQQRLYIVSSELLCSSAPAFGNLITWLHQLLLGNTQRNKTRRVRRSVVWSLSNKQANPSVTSPADGAKTSRRLSLLAPGVTF